MVAPTRGSLRKVAAIWIVGLATVIGVACATSKSPETGDGSEADSLTGLRVESEGETTLVTLEGVDGANFTAVLNREMRTLVVDLNAVEMDTLENLQEVYDGLVDYVTLSSYGAGDGEAATRVEVALAVEDAEYDVLPVEDGLQVRVRESLGIAAERMADESLAAAEWAPADEALAEASEVEVSQEGDPWEDPQAEPALDAALDEGEAGLEVEIPAPPAATRLASVSTQEFSDGLLIHLEADGSVWAVESFTLENPDRLVVDLPGLTAPGVGKTFEVGSGRVNRIRVGAHSDKVRVVIDGGADAAGFAARSVKPSADGLLVAVGSGESLEMAMQGAISAAEEAWTTRALETGLAAAPAPAMEPSSDEPAEELAEEIAEEFAEESAGELAAESVVTQAQEVVGSGSVEIYGLQYESRDEIDRIAILSEGVVDYAVLTPDAETVVVSLLNSVISDEASGRIMAAEGAPISLITAFQQPDVPGQEVRVVVKRAPNVAPEVTRRGSLIFVDFPHSGVAAAGPPAFADSQSLAAAASPDAASPEAAAPASLQTMDEMPAASESIAAADTDPVAVPDLTGNTASETAAMDPPAGLEEGFVAGELTAEENVAAMPAPEPSAAVAPAPVAPAPVPAAPASLEPPAAVAILQEGGLIDGKAYMGRRISLDFNNVPVSDVLRLIAEVSDLNLIAGDEVQGNVTIRLVDVPWDQALDVVLLTKGLGFVRVGNILRVAPADIIKAEEELRLQERRNKEKLEDLVVKLQPVNYAKVKEMSGLVKRLLSSRGTVNVDERTNTLILKDIQSVIDEAIALVKAVDTETPQVMIEAKIMEAGLDFSRELGSEWSVGTQPLEDPWSGNEPRRDLGGQDFRFHGDNSVTFSNPITANPTAAMNLGAYLLDEKMNLDVRLRAAESQGEGKVISSPRIVTLDNREATIEQGVSIPFQTFESGDAKLEFIDAVLSLKVKPHITADRSIIMEIRVTRNAPDDTIATPTGSPAIAKAEAETETLVKDGQTLVIGGIYTIVKSERESRVPYLWRMPLIGVLFKSKEITDSRKELLMFVTPRIVQSPELAATH
ncbi:MAG: type IV pilus secretin PilQ [Deltaproteobacteria bacterium]|nr:type IV pilus secretin PilQ [Deltaproteobacteria bacterium]